MKVVSLTKSGYECLDLCHSVVVDLLLVGLVALALIASFLSVALLTTLVFLGLLLLLRLVVRGLCLLNGCFTWLWQVLHFFDLVYGSEAFEVVCDNLLLSWEKCCLHLKGLCVRFLVLWFAWLVSIGV